MENAETNPLESEPIISEPAVNWKANWGWFLLAGGILVVGSLAVYSLFFNKSAGFDQASLTAGLTPRKAATVAPTVTATATPLTVTATPVADPYAGWKQYCAPIEKSCFKYPSDWTTKKIGGVDENGDGLELTAPNGFSLSFDSTVSGLGGTCSPTDPHVYIHKLTPVPAVSGLYVAEAGHKDVTDTVGIIDGNDVAGKPALGDTGSCALYFAFASRHDTRGAVGNMFASGIESAIHAKPQLSSTDLAIAELILQSYTYTNSPN